MKWWHWVLVAVGGVFVLTFLLPSNASASEGQSLGGGTDGTTGAAGVSNPGDSGGFVANILSSIGGLIGKVIPGVSTPKVPPTIGNSPPGANTPGVSSGGAPSAPPLIPPGLPGAGTPQLPQGQDPTGAVPIGVHIAVPAPPHTATPPPTAGAAGTGASASSVYQSPAQVILRRATLPPGPIIVGGRRVNTL